MSDRSPGVMTRVPSTRWSRKLGSSIAPILISSTSRLKLSGSPLQRPASRYSAISPTVGSASMASSGRTKIGTRVFSLAISPRISSTRSGATRLTKRAKTSHLLVSNKFSSTKDLPMTSCGHRGRQGAEVVGDIDIEVEGQSRRYIMEAGAQAYDDIALRLEGSVFFEDPLQDLAIFLFSHKSAGLLIGHPVPDSVGERKVVTVGNQTNGVILGLSLTDEGTKKAQFLYVPGEEFHDPEQDDRFAGLRFGPKYVDAFRFRHDYPPLIHLFQGEPFPPISPSPESSGRKSSAKNPCNSHPPA